MAASRQYVFGEFHLDAVQRALFRKNELIALTPKSLETLMYLVEHHGRIVDKQDLMDAVWPGTFVEEASLAKNVSLLRKILSETENEHSYIETIPKRGYRFVAKVKEISSEGELQPPGESPEATALRTKGSGHRRPVWAMLSLLAVVALAGSLAWRHFSTGRARASSRVMLAVLPVQNLSGDPEREYISDGLTEELIAQLGNLNPATLGVIARTSSMAYKRTTKTVDQIAKDLAVDYVLEASLRQSGNRLRITAQLIRTNDQIHIWAHDYDSAASDIVTLQDDLGRAVASQIKLQLTPEGRERLARSRQQNPEAYQLYLKGRFYWNTRSKEGLEKALDFFQKALEKNPEDARAYAGMADSYNLQGFYGYSPGSGTLLMAKAAAEKAIQLDGSLAEGHAALAYLNCMSLWDWPTAEREFRRAIELDENYLPAHHWYAIYLAAMGRPREASEEIEVARKLDPLSPIVNTAAGWIHYFARDYDLALRESKAVLEVNPNFMVAHAVMGDSYEGKGMSGEAIAEFQKALELSGGEAPNYLGYLGHAYAMAGRRAEAQKMLDELDELAKHGFLGLSHKAIIYAGLGEKEKTIEYLQGAGNQNDGNMLWLRVDPRFDSVRSDPRFQEILKNQGTK